MFTLTVIIMRGLVKLRVN